MTVAELIHTRMSPSAVDALEFRAADGGVVRMDIPLQTLELARIIKPGPSARREARRLHRFGCRATRPDGADYLLTCRGHLMRVAVRPEVFERLQALGSRRQCRKRTTPEVALRRAAARVAAVFAALGMLWARDTDRGIGSVVHRWTSAVGLTHCQQCSGRKTRWDAAYPNRRYKHKHKGGKRCQHSSGCREARISPLAPIGAT